MFGFRAQSAGRAAAALVAVPLLLAACSGTTATTTTTVSPEPDRGAGPTTTSAPAPSESGPQPTAAPTTTAASTPWKELAETAIVGLPPAMSGTADPLAFAQDNFSLPVELPTPGDVQLSGAYLRVDELDGVVSARWDIRFASELPAADIEATVSAGIRDPRFEPGIRVVSQLKNGDYVTLNFAPTSVGEQDGWSSMSITIGPETDLDGPTGRNELQVAVERNRATLSEFGLAPFLVAWESHMPTPPEGAAFAGFTADITKLQTNGIWLEFTYHAPQSAFDALVKFYAQDLSQGDLELRDSSMPADLSTLEYFSAGFFPKLAGFDIDVTVERRLSDPADPVAVRYRVRVEPLDSEGS